MSSASTEVEEQLKAILGRPAPMELCKDDLETVLPALTSPTVSKERTLALAILARAVNPEPVNSTLSSLKTTIEDRLSGTDTTDLVSGLSTLSALLQVAPSLGVDLLKRDGIRQNLEEAVELIITPGSGKRRREEERLALVELLSLGAGQSPLRAQIRSSAGPWLEGLLGEPADGGTGRDGPLLALAAVGVVKLRLVNEKPEEGGSVHEPEGRPSKWSLVQLAVLFHKLFIRTAPRSISPPAPAPLSSPQTQVLLACLEGLAYLTLVPSLTIKPAIATGPFLDAFLGLLPAITPPSSSSPLDFAVATLLDHLTAFPPPADSKGDAAQIHRLKAFASVKQKGPAPEVESLTSATARVSLIASHSPLPTVRQLCLSSSLACRRVASRIILSLVTPAPLRGALLQGGIARMALSLIRQIPSPFSPSEDVYPIQALAKLLITTNPLLVLGPQTSSPLLAEGVIALIKPLGVLDDGQFGGGTGLLVKFECLMALTNISSLDADIFASVKLRAESGGKDRKLLHVVEELMLSNNIMIRRAATELMCNLVASQGGFEHFAVNPFPSSPKPTDAAPPPNSHLNLITALASSPDFQTRQAAAGALTSLAMDPTLALSMALYPRALEILIELISEKGQDGLRHRAYDVLRSVAIGVGSANDVAWKERGRKGMDEAGVRKALQAAVEGEEKVDELKEVAKEALVAME